jgi:hypothetical protein
MTQKIRRQSLPQPGGGNPHTGASGNAAFNALSNHAFASQNAIGATTAGPDIVTGGVAFTPKVSGRVLFMWSSSGAVANATVQTTFAPSMNLASAPTVPVVSGPTYVSGANPNGTGTEVAGGSATFTLAGLVVGTAYVATVPFTAVGGTGYNPTAGAGSITVVELPG